MTLVPRAQSLLVAALLTLSVLPAVAQESRGALIAYTYADQPTTASYSPQAAYTLNPEGDVSLSRTGTGTYVVRFNGLATAFRDRSTSTEGEAGSAGHVQVSAVGTPGAYCKTNGWGESGEALHVNVRCFDAGGALTDTRFTTLFLEPAVNAGALGFVWANQAASPAYVAGDKWAYNGAGGVTRVDHPASGFYVVRFEGMARYLESGDAGVVHVTSTGTDNTTCQATNWGRDGDDYRAFVVCREPGGRLTDGTFALATLWPELQVGRHAYAHADQPSATAQYEPETAFNGGRSVFVTPLGTGSYRVYFSGFTNVFGGQVQVHARSDPQTTCQVESWGPNSGSLRVNVRCTDAAASPTNTAFAVSAFFGTAPTPGNTDVVTGFDSFSDGDLLVSQLFDRGIRFANSGATVIACTSGSIVCIRSRSARNVIAPADLSTEFQRDELRMRFAEEQTEVIASFNSAILDGQERILTMEARRGSTVFSSATATLRGEPGWPARLRVTGSNITQVVVTARRTSDGVVDNQFVIDDLYYDDTTPYPTSDTPPRLVLWNIDGNHLYSGKVYTESPIDYEIQASDLGLTEVTSEMSRVSDGGTVQPRTVLCGTPATGSCTTYFLRAVAVGVSAPGEYRIVVTATNLAGLTATRDVTVIYDPPDPPPPAFVHKVEFNQSVTPFVYNRNVFLDDDVFVIPGKNLLVRYFLHSEGAPRDSFAASMRIKIIRTDGTEINRNLSPNAGNPLVNLSPLPEDVGDARRDTLISMRADLGRTLNYVIPGDWLDDAMFAEIVLWDGVRELSRAQIGDIESNKSTLALQMVYVNDQQYLDLGRDNFDANVRPYLEQALPYGEVEILSERGFNYNGEVILGASSPCAHLVWALSYYGDDHGPMGLPDDTRLWWSKLLLAEDEDLLPNMTCLGVANRPGRNAMSRFEGGVAAHELGHNLGLMHATKLHGETTTFDWETNPWPYYHGAIGQPWATFGIIMDPVASPTPTDSGTWDLFLIDPCPSASPEDRYADGACPVMDTAHNTVPHEVMSYGGNASLDASSVPETRGQWPSYLTYKRMFEGGERRSRTSAASVLAAANSTPRALRTRNDGPPQALIATGIIRGDGTAQVLPLLGRTASLDELARQQPGDYLVELLGDGNVLASTTVAESALSDEEGTVLFVQALLPYMENVTGVRISRAGTVVVEQLASMHAPVVQVLHPNGAEQFEDGVFDVRWAGSDADGDSLSYLVEYSPDNGATWETIRVVLPGSPTVFTVRTDGLANGVRGRIRVTASDGIHLSRDVSNGYFSVGPEPPITSYDIYTVDAASSTPRRITYLDETGEFNPDWSPDGSQIVHDVTTFAEDGNVVAQDLYITDVLTSSSTPLVGGEGGNDAVWHPDSTQILFDRCPQGTVAPLCEPSLFRISAAGGTPTLVRENAIDGDWSHTGRLVVFHQPSDGSLRALHLVSGREELVAALGTNPVWSLDDKYIAYVNGGDLYRVRVNGSGKPRGAPERLTTDPAQDGQPSWSPAGTSIVFHSDRSGDFDLYELAIGGTVSLLASKPGTGDFDPAVAPSGSPVAYAGFTGTAPAAPGARVGSISSEARDLEPVTPTALDATSYPNPFTPSTTIRFTLPRGGHTTVTVYDVLGREIETLVAGSLGVGTHAVRFDATHLPSGTYFYRIESGGERLVRQIVRM